MKKLEVKESRIKGAGNGLFAGEDIKAGEILFRTFEYSSLDKNEKRFSKCFAQTHPGGKLNHSKHPNTIAVYNFRKRWVSNMAIADIKRGAEILADYMQLIEMIPTIGFIPDINYLDFYK